MSAQMHGHRHSHVHVHVHADQHSRTQIKHSCRSFPLTYRFCWSHILPISFEVNQNLISFIKFIIFFKSQFLPDKNLNTLSRLLHSLASPHHQNWLICMPKLCPLRQVSLPLSPAPPAAVKTVRTHFSRRSPIRKIRKMLGAAPFFLRRCLTTPFPAV